MWVQNLGIKYQTGNGHKLENAPQLCLGYSPPTSAHRSNKNIRSDTRGTLPDIAANSPSPARVTLSHERVQIHARENLCSLTRQIRTTLSRAWVVIVRHLDWHFNHARRGRALAAISGKVPSVSGVCLCYIIVSHKHHLHARFCIVNSAPAQSVRVYTWSNGSTNQHR